MSKLKITIIVLFVVILGALSGAVYYASTLISPEEVRRLTMQKLEEAFPNSKIELGELNFNIGTTFKFDLDKLVISAPQKDPKPLLAVEDIHMKVPVWAILFGGGEIDVRVSSPEVHYVTAGDLNNWSSAMQGDDKQKPQEDQKEKSSAPEGEGSQAAMIVPGFLANSQLNLKVSDLKVHYQMDEQKGDLDIAKFLIRNLNFESSTAFELDSRLNFELSEDQKVSFDTLIIGQFNLGHYIKNEELPVMAVIKVNNLEAPMLVRPLNEIKTDLKVVVKNQEISGNIDVRLLKDVSLSSGFVTTKQRTGLNSIKANIPLEEVLSLVDMKLDGFNFSKAILSANGEVKILENGVISPNLNLEVGPSIAQNFKGETLRHEFEASLIEKEFKSKMTSELFSGTMIARMDAPIDLNQEISMDNLPKFTSSVNLTNLSISKKFIQEVLYSPEKESKKQEAPTEEKTSEQESKSAPLVLPPGTLTLTLTNINLAGEVLSGDGVFELAPNYAATKKLDFEYSNGQGKLTHLTKLTPDFFNHQFDFSLANFNLSGAQAFLPPTLGDVSGNFSMTAKGSAKTPASSQGQNSFDVVMDARGTEGEAQVLVKLGEKINDLLSKVPKLSDKINSKKPLEVDGSFDEVVVKSKLSEKKYGFNQLKFIGSGKRFSLEGRGDVYPPALEKKSIMHFTYKENKGNLVAPLRDLTGGNEVPLRLEGIGYALKPDYGYTIEILAKSALKSQGEKIIKKETKKIESKLKEELEKKGKEKLKNLFGL